MLGVFFYIVSGDFMGYAKSAYVGAAEFRSFGVDGFCTKNGAKDNFAYLVIHQNKVFIIK